MNNIINLFLQNAEQLELFIKSDVNLALNGLSMANDAIINKIQAKGIDMSELDTPTSTPINPNNDFYDFMSSVHEQTSDSDVKIEPDFNYNEPPETNNNLDDHSIMFAGFHNTNNPYLKQAIYETKNPNQHATNETVLNTNQSATDRNNILMDQLLSNKEKNNTELEAKKQSITKSNSFSSKQLGISEHGTKYSGPNGSKFC